MWCRSVRTDHFAHLLTGLSPVVPGPSPVTGDSEKQGGIRLSPVSPVGPGPNQIREAADAVEQRTIEDLHGALAQAAEGLPITLPELIEAFGAEGAADWTEGYAPHCHPKFLRTLAATVAARLERERDA